MLLIIDGSSLLSSSYYGNLPLYYKANRKHMSEEEKQKCWKQILQTSKGVYTNGIYTMLKNMLAIIERAKPTYLAIVWDISKNTFRKELMNDYKGQRKDREEPLVQQFETIQWILNRMGIAQFAASYYEADDFAGSLVHKFKDETPIRLYTKDKDYLQLVNTNTHLWLIQDKKKIEELKEKWKGHHHEFVPTNAFSYDIQLVKEEFGIWPYQVSDWKALGGDVSDNIPGVKGISDKTAIKLLSIFSNIPSLYKSIETWMRKNENVFLRITRFVTLIHF